MNLQLDDRLTQRRQMERDDAPDDLWRDAVILVTENVPDAADHGPGQPRLRRQQFFRKVPHGLRNVLNSTLHGKAQQPVAIKGFEGFPFGGTLNFVDAIENVGQYRGYAPAHQNTRMADCSMSARSIGCRLSRVVT